MTKFGASLLVVSFIIAYVAYKLHPLTKCECGNELKDDDIALCSECLKKAGIVNDDD